MGKKKRERKRGIYVVWFDEKEKKMVIGEKRKLKGCDIWMDDDL